MQVMWHSMYQTTGGSYLLKNMIQASSQIQMASQMQKAWRMECQTS